MADPGAGPSAPPGEDPAEAFLEAHVNDACGETFFQCGAVDLAVSLIGQYLYFHASRTVVRILETEAYPADDAVYDLKVRDRTLDVKALFKLKGGTLLAWSPSHFTGEHPELYITAGPANTGDLVHIRSCEPIIGAPHFHAQFTSFGRYPYDTHVIPMRCSGGVSCD
jgi:3-methyladenine DNA glycosylase Mpg